MTVQEFLLLLLRRWWLVLLSVALGATAGLVYESSQPKVMATEGRLVIGPSLDDDLNVIQSTDSLSRGTLQETLAEIVTGNQVVRAARAEVGNRSSAYDVDAVVVPDTNVTTVTVSGPDGDAAMALASAVMSEAEQAFEDLYPVYNIAVVDQPDEPQQTAPNPELGLVVGALAGALLVSLGLTVLDEGRRAEPDPQRGSEQPRSASPSVSEAAPEAESSTIERKSTLVVDVADDPLLRATEPEIDLLTAADPEIDEPDWLREDWASAGKPEPERGGDGSADGAGPTG